MQLPPGHALDLTTQEDDALAFEVLASTSMQEFRLFFPPWSFGCSVSHDGDGIHVVFSIDSHSMLSRARGKPHGVFGGLIATF